MDGVCEEKRAAKEREKESMKTTGLPDGSTFMVNIITDMNRDFITVSIDRIGKCNCTIEVDISGIIVKTLVDTGATAGNYIHKDLFKQG